MARYRGELYIHASRWDGSPDQPTPGDGVTGAIIGRVQLIDAVDLESLLESDGSRRTNKPNSGKRRGQSPESNRARALRELARRHGLPARPENLEHVHGPICLILDERQPLAEPVAAKGQLNIWRFEAPPSQLRIGDVTL
jgi:hypothetical protein